jgi:dTDP-4-dehydrorhamnose 3,5-epimerase-like enzyme
MVYSKCDKIINRPENGRIGRKMEIRNYKIYDTYGPDAALTGSWARLLKDDIAQVNMVEVAPYTFQGWYIHGDRNEWYVGIKGDLLVCEANGQAVSAMGTAIFVPKLIAHGLYNASAETAWILVLSDQPHEMDEDSWGLPVQINELDALEIIWNNMYPERLPDVQ